MAANLNFSRKKARCSMKSTKPALPALARARVSRTGREGSLPATTAHEAIQLLQSAIGYMQLTGITVHAQNTFEGLQLTIPGACYAVSADNSAAAFRIGTPTPKDDHPSVRGIFVVG